MMNNIVIIEVAYLRRTTSNKQQLGPASFLLLAAVLDYS